MKELTEAHEKAGQAGIELDHLLTWGEISDEHRELLTDAVNHLQLARAIIHRVMWRQEVAGEGQ